MFLLRLATEVDYKTPDESRFISGVADELSFYYARYVDLLTLQSQAIDYGSGSQAKPASGTAAESEPEETKEEAASKAEKEQVEKTIDEFKFALEHEILPDMKRNF